jgi:cold-inducible RNA-binding protein
MKKLFVGSLSFNTTESELEGAFNRFGKLAEVKIIMDRMTGRSRGFGFITFESDEAAQAAMSEMDGTNLDGRTITVNEAQEQRREGRGPRGGGRGGSRGGGRDRNW